MIEHFLQSHLCMDASFGYSFETFASNPLICFGEIFDLAQQDHHVDDGAFAGIDFNSNVLDLDQDFLSLVPAPYPEPPVIASSQEPEHMTWAQQQNEERLLPMDVQGCALDAPVEVPSGSSGPAIIVFEPSETSTTNMDLDTIIDLNLREFKQAVSGLPEPLQREAKKLRRRKQNSDAHKRLDLRKRKNEERLMDDLRCTRDQLERVYAVVLGAVNAHFPQLDDPTRNGFLSAVKSALNLA